MKFGFQITFHSTYKQTWQLTRSFTEML